MSAIHTWACLLLCLGFTTQDKTPEVAVTCFVSQECVLPCKFQPGQDETIEWLRQDAVVYKFERQKDDDDDDEEEDRHGKDGDDKDDSRDDDSHDDEDDDDGDSSEEQRDQPRTQQQHKPQQGPLAGRAAVFPHLVSRGNATLIIKGCGLKDRGAYRCHVKTSSGEHNSKIIVKVEAPIRTLAVELSRLSGYEEMKCTVRNVFPAPRVTWVTEPKTFEDLRPVTRKLADKQGLYTVDSRIKPVKGQPDLIYICRVTAPYEGPTWTASIRERADVRGTQGKDLTLPCKAPPYMNNPFLVWTFSNGEDPSHILSYDSNTDKSDSSRPWENHVELDGFRVPFGDGSLRLMDPHPEHTGTYTCVFSVPYSTHTEHCDVTIDNPAGARSISEAPSHWWVAGLVVGGLVLVLAAMLVYLKTRGGVSKPRNDPEEVTELHSVKASAAGGHVNESSHLNTGSAGGGGTNGQSNPQT